MYIRVIKNTLKVETFHLFFYFIFRMNERLRLDILDRHTFSKLPDGLVPDRLEQCSVHSNQRLSCALGTFSPMDDSSPVSNLDATGESITLGARTGQLANGFHGTYRCPELGPHDFAKLFTRAAIGRIFFTHQQILAKH